MMMLSDETATMHRKAMLPKFNTMVPVRETLPATMMDSQQAKKMTMMASETKPTKIRVIANIPQEVLMSK